ncbi:MAG TPA: hypothetical protein VKD47_02955 [Miltoncostaeaceae bacterium]|nr:hypothetical protein [Miltoncostaeaceae bacterium]
MIVALFIAIGRLLRWPLARFLVRRFGLAFPVARIITTALFLGLAVAQRVLRARRSVRRAGRRRRR